MGNLSKKIIIIGGVGNGSVIAAAIKDANRFGNDEWIVAGYLNDRMKKGEDLEGSPVLGNLKDISHFLGKDYYFIYTIYRIDGQIRRISLFEELNIPDEKLATFVHPQSYVAPAVELGAGTVIQPNVCISPQVKAGKCCLFMQGATIGHNNEIGDFCHITAQAALGSYLKIGKGVHIGLNATVREYVKMADYSTIGAGSLLLNDTGEREIWVGVPAKFLRITREDE